MIENYTQTLDIKLSHEARINQIASVVLFFFSIAFLVVSILFHLGFLAGCFLFVILSIVSLVLFNRNAKEYKYAFNEHSIAIYKTNVLNETKRIVLLQLKDAEDFKILDGIINKSDIIACEDPTKINVYEINFCIEENKYRLIFEPDNYLVDLLNEVING